MTAAEFVPEGAGITQLREAAKDCRGCELWENARRGALMERETSLGPRRFLVTIHPSAVLRADDQDAAYAGLVAELRVAASVLR